MAKRKSLPQKPRSLLATIAGDNNPSAAGLEDVSEMCQVGASKTVPGAVQNDTKGDFDGVVRHEITEPDPTGTAHRTVIARMPSWTPAIPKRCRTPDAKRWRRK